MEHESVVWTIWHGLAGACLVGVILGINPRWCNWQHIGFWFTHARWLLGCRSHYHTDSNSNLRFAACLPSGKQAPFLAVSRSFELETVSNPPSSCPSLGWKKELSEALTFYAGFGRLLGLPL